MWDKIRGGVNFEAFVMAMTVLVIGSLQMANLGYSAPSTVAPSQQGPGLAGSVGPVPPSANKFSPGLGVVNTTSPQNGEGNVALTRETIITFSRPIRRVAYGPFSFSARFAGQDLPATIHLSQDRKKIYLFYTNPLPETATVFVTVAGDFILDDNNRKIDADGDGIPGGSRSVSFTTLTTTSVPGTVICGRIFASELDPNGGPSTNVPLENVRISVDGSSPVIEVFTDSMGNFRMEDAPAGRFFIHIDGSTANVMLPPGAYYPTVGKAWESIPAQEMTVGNIFLPLIRAGTLQPVSNSQRTMVEFPAAVITTYPELAGTELMIPAASLIDNQGNPGGMVGIGPVAPDRLPGVLPAGLNPPIVITIQTNGPTNFDSPVPAKFPNLPDPVTGLVLPPGAKTALWSFDHDLGQWAVVGGMTVDPTGAFVVSDPGTGILAPGWHFPLVGATASAPPPRESMADPCVIQALKAMNTCLGALPGGNCFQSVGGSFAGALLDCAPPNSGTSCAYSVAENTLGSILDCTGDGAGWLATTLNSLMSVKSAFDCGFEVGNIINVCFLGMPPTPGINEALAGLSDQVDKIEKVAKPYENFFGDEIWSQGDPNDSEMYSSWLTDFRSAITPASEMGPIVSPGERQGLVASPPQSQIPSMEVNDFLDRYNRTLDYWAQGIFELLDVPAGMSTDFIIQSEMLNSLDEAILALDEIQNQGYESIYGGMRHWIGRLKDELVAEDTGGTPATEELFYRIASVGGAIELRGKTSPSGTISNAILGTNIDYIVSYVVPSTFTVGETCFSTGGNGSTTTISTTLLAPSTAPDTDADGLPDDAERIIGSDPMNWDSDNDGLSDGVEVQQGTDPIENTPAVTGIVSTANTAGTATDVHSFDDLVAVADGASGVSIFNVFNGLNPLIVAQVDTPGFASQVSLWGQRALVADGSEGLAIVDFSDPANAQVVYQLDANFLGGNAVAVESVAGVCFVAHDQPGITAVDVKTGAKLSSLQTPTQVTDLFATGEYLYALSATRLYTLPLFDLDLSIEGEVSYNGSYIPGSLRLFVGGGIAYATEAGGFNTFDVSNPQSPQVIASNSAGFGGWRQLVANGSGTGIAAVGPSSAGPSEVEMYDISNPSNTSGFLARFLTPGLAVSASIYNGRAYIGDSLAGIQVLNYRSFDTAGIPPTITIAPNVPGSTVEEGTFLLINVDVADDNQVRNVELYVDNQKVQTDGGFPFEFVIKVPLLTQQTTLTLAARASDTGGNATRTADTVLQITPDLTSPTVVFSSPDIGSPLYTEYFDQTGFVVRFSESMEAEDFSAASVIATAAGPDNQLDTGDDVLMPATLSLIFEDRQLAVAVPNAPVGALRLRLVGSLLSDNAGNILDANDDGIVGEDFDIVIDNTDEPTVYWITDLSGQWSNGGNWSTGQVPLATEIVVIDRLNSTVTVTHSSGAGVCKGIHSTESLRLTGGTLWVDATLNASGLFEMAGGTLLNATIPAGDEAFVVGHSTFDNCQVDGTVRVVNGNATIRNGLELNGEWILNPNRSVNFVDTQTLTGTGELRTTGGWLRECAHRAVDD